MGETQLCTLSGLHNQEVKPEVGNSLMYAPGEPFSLDWMVTIMAPSVDTEGSVRQQANDATWFNVIIHKQKHCNENDIPLLTLHKAYTQDL